MKLILKFVIALAGALLAANGHAALSVFACEPEWAALVREITARLRHLCQHMSDDEFGRLVADIAETRLRFAAIDASYPPRPQPARSAH